MYQKVWPVLGAHAGAKKTYFLPDFGPDLFIRPSFTNSCATLGINQTPPNEASLTGALCLYFASIDGCPLFARTSSLPSPPVPSPLIFPTKRGNGAYKCGRRKARRRICTTTITRKRGRQGHRLCQGGRKAPPCFGGAIHHTLLRGPPNCPEASPKLPLNLSLIHISEPTRPY